ncbi:hypothetical protein [Youngiibacter fragilis]|uniref:hypothetical protein n=1 Tax=Youngiibacter fragilis TaxID=1408819 RepID=UPI0004063B0F|nr:hypothetical protein [Youngiibacter fragilis]
MQREVQKSENLLVHKKSDLSDIENGLPAADMIVANLFIEYIGIDTFTEQPSKNNPTYVSCVIQKNPNVSFVSDSHYAEALNGIESLHRDIKNDSLVKSMSSIG